MHVGRTRVVLNFVIITEQDKNVLELVRLGTVEFALNLGVALISIKFSDQGHRADQ